MTVRELLTRMDSKEISEWMAYYRLEPFGEERADLRSGIIASILANVHRKKGAAAFGPEDFMYRAEQPEAKPTAGELMKKAASALGLGRKRVR